MRNKKLVSAIALQGILLAGCSGSAYEPKPHTLSLKDDQVLANTASLSKTYTVTRSSDYFFCTEPAPDATFAQQETGDISISLINAGTKSSGDKSSISEGSSGHQMEGRTPVVLISRELLYRLCEFSFNHKLSKDDAVKLYTQNLEIIKALSLAETANTQLKLYQSDMEKDSTTNSGFSAPSTNAQGATTTSTAPSQQSGSSTNTTTTNLGQCSDGVDNDNDGYFDAADPQCVGNSTSEFTPQQSGTTPSTGGAGNRTVNQCTDGIDNDNDGLIDGADVQCVETSTSES